MMGIMISSKRRWFHTVSLAVIALMISLAPIIAMANAVNGEEDVRPDGRLQGFNGTVTPEGGSSLTYMFFVVLVLITAGICFMNAKRSHLD
jgi:hypothetical protein